MDSICYVKRKLWKAVNFVFHPWLNMPENLISKLYFLANNVVYVTTYTVSNSSDEHSLKAILDSISTVAADWFNLGVALGLSYSTLKTIESDYPRAPRCLTEMLIAWLQNSSQPTWRGLVLALESPLVNRVDIATTIAKDHSC